MTCIVGYVDKERNVWMGCDSAACTSYNIWERTDEKVFVVDDMIYGFTSSFRMGQILRFSFKRPKQQTKRSDYEYLCTSWIDKLRELLKDKGFAHIKENEETGGQFLVGYKGNLYSVDMDFQVGQHALHYDAVGCAKDFALASMFTLETMKSKLGPASKIEMALKSAEKFSTYVKSPFVIRYLTP